MFCFKHVSKFLFVFFFSFTVFSLDKVGEFPIVATVDDIAVYGNYVLTTHLDSGMRVYDVTTPSSPVAIGAYDSATCQEQCDGIVVSGDYAYVACNNRGLRIFSLANPANPTLAGEVKTPEDAEHVAVSGTVAYVVCGSHGIHCIDVSTIATPTILGSYYANADSSSYQPVIELAVQGNYAYIAFEDSGLHIVNITNPAAPAYAGKYFEDDGLRIWGVKVSGDYAFLACYNEGLKIVDIKDPASPTLTGSYDVPDNMDADAWDVAVVNKYAMILYQAWGMHLIDFSTPATPVKADAYPPGVVVGGDYRQMAISDKYAFLYHDDKELVQIVDITSIVPIIGNPGITLPDNSFVIQNSANPWSKPIVINLILDNIPAGRHLIDLALYSANGKLINTLYSDLNRKSHYSFTWKGIDGKGKKVPSGSYYCRLSVSGVGEKTRMIVLRK